MMHAPRPHVGKQECSQGLRPWYHKGKNADDSIVPKAQQFALPRLTAWVGGSHPGIRLRANGTDVCTSAESANIVHVFHPTTV
jgi:hypothetical protein